MGRIQGLFEVQSKVNKQIKAGPGFVHSVTIGYKGATAGDVVSLKDGLDASGSDAVLFVLPAANGTLNREWSQGKQFLTGIYLVVNGTGVELVEVTAQ